MLLMLSFILGVSYRSNFIPAGESELCDPVASGPDAVSLSGPVLPRARRRLAKRGALDGHRVRQECARDQDDTVIRSKLAAGVLQRRAHRLRGFLRGRFPRTCEHIS